MERDGDCQSQVEAGRAQRAAGGGGPGARCELGPGEADVERAGANGGGITDYVIQRSTNGVTWTTVSDGVSPAKTFTVRGLRNGTPYRFRVAAKNAVGIGPSSATAIATPKWKPAAPTGLRAAVAPAPGVSSRRSEADLERSFEQRVGDLRLRHSTLGQRQAVDDGP